MPSKKKKYNARFPAGRIKKIMQSDEEIGKVAQAVPVIISRTLELFVESLLNKTLKITNSRNAKTLSTSHMKQCIMSEQRFDFLRELVKNIPDISVAEEAANYNEDDPLSSPEQQNYPDSDTPYDLSMPSTSNQATRASTNGDFQQPQIPLRYVENGSRMMTTSRRSLSNEEHMRTNVDERRAHLKRHATGATRAISDATDDIANQPKTKKVNASKEQLHKSLEHDALLMYTAEAASFDRTHEDQMRAHLMRQAALAQCLSSSNGILQGVRANDVDARPLEVDLTNAARGQLSHEQFLTHRDNGLVHMKHESAIEKHMCQRKMSRAQSVSIPSSSVIRHTTTLPTAAPASHLPPKLYRTDSAPATAAGNWQQQQHRQLMPDTKSFNMLHQQRRQSKSIPSGYNKVNTPPHTTTSVQPQFSPIPAPIVSTDFCNKPVVKIDYSNISMPKMCTAPIVAPLSAPVTMSGSTAKNNAVDFNFTAEPVFNIDLSNITTSANAMNNPAAIATISIGNIASMPSFLNTLVAAPTNLKNNANYPINHTASRNVSASSEFEKLSPSTGATATPTPLLSSAMATNKNNQFFELDEDYDNI